MGFAALLLLGGGALYLVLVDGYRQAYDHEIIETSSLARELYRMDRTEYPTPAGAIAHIMSELVTVDRSLAAFDSTGRRIAVARRAPLAPDLSHVSLLSTGTQPTTTIVAGETVRLMRFALADGVEMVVGVSEVEFVARVHTLRMALGIGGPILLLLGALLGMRLADPVLDLHRAFLADAAHELRTPLAIIMSEADAGRMTGDPDRMRASLDAVAQEAGRMGTIVGDLLVLARHDSHANPAREPLFLDDIAQRTISRVRTLPESSGRPIVLGQWDEAPVYGDPVLLERAIMALLHNALVHAPSGPITVETGVDGGCAWVRVCDTGHGIGEDDRERIFDRGARLLPGKPGSGLGLPIVRAIAEAHGGTVVVGGGESGAIFTLQLTRRDIHSRDSVSST